MKMTTKWGIGISVVAVLGVLALVFLVVTGPISNSADEESQTPTSTQNSASQVEMQTSTSSETVSTSTGSTSTSSEESEAIQTEPLSQAQVLDVAAEAVVRITGDGFQPHAGVLIGQETSFVVSAVMSGASEASALFENGSVADLSLTTEREGVSIYGVSSDDQLSPIPLPRSLPEVGQRVYAVPLGPQPQILNTQITGVGDRLKIDLTTLPNGSLLLNQRAEILGIFDRQNINFIPIFTIITN